MRDEAQELAAENTATPGKPTKTHDTTVCQWCGEDTFFGHDFCSFECEKAWQESLAIEEERNGRLRF